MTVLPRFALGRVLITPAARDHCVALALNVWPLLERHAAGDGGTLDDHDREANETALRTGEGRIWSVYPAGTERLWIITDRPDDPDGNITTVMLPSDY